MANGSGVNEVLLTAIVWGSPALFLCFFALSLIEQSHIPNFLFCSGCVLAMAMVMTLTGLFGRFWFGA